MSGLTSLSLLERVRGGEEVGWERLSSLYRPLVISWCVRGGAGADAEDLAAFLAAILPDDERSRDPGAPRHLDEAALATPFVAVSNAARETLRMADIVEVMLRGARDAFHEDDPDIFENDRLRQNALVLSGWRVLRFTYAMLINEPAQVIATIRRALARS